MALNLPNIKRNTLQTLKVIWKVLLFVLSLIINISLIILSSPIWLPVVLWKTGLIVSDHIMKQIIDV